VVEYRNLYKEEEEKVLNMYIQLHLPLCIRCWDSKTASKYIAGSNFKLYQTPLLTK